ncbi:MAG: DUF924 domain-containing protein [Nanoarchaeota archaeon]|nr:DUF924 domain-containing protein [Nanoarchaeota archaeon]
MTNYNKILHFWFEELTPSNWFTKNSKIDAKIKEEFEEELNNFNLKSIDTISNKDEILGAIILLDQFPRNIYRDTKKAFEFDTYALKLTKKAIELRIHNKFTGPKRSFLYMPLMHSEDIKDQEECVKLFSESTLEDINLYIHNLKFAILHYEIIKKFGRYPHRNNILKRKSTKEELEFLKQPNSSF